MHVSTYEQADKIANVATSAKTQKIDVCIYILPHVAYFTSVKSKLTPSEKKFQELQFLLAPILQESSYFLRHILENVVSSHAYTCEVLKSALKHCC